PHQYDITLFGIEIHISPNVTVGAAGNSSNFFANANYGVFAWLFSGINVTKNEFIDMKFLTTTPPFPVSIFNAPYGGVGVFSTICWNQNISVNENTMYSIDYV